MPKHKEWSARELEVFSQAWEYLAAKTPAIKQQVTEFNQSNTIGVKAFYAATQPPGIDGIRWGRLAGLVPVLEEEYSEEQQGYVLVAKRVDPISAHMKEEEHPPIPIYVRAKVMTNAAIITLDKFVSEIAMRHDLRKIVRGDDWSYYHRLFAYPPEPPELLSMVYEIKPDFKKFK